MLSKDLELMDHNLEICFVSGLINIETYFFQLLLTPTFIYRYAFKGRVSSIFLKNKIQTYIKCGGDCVCRASPLYLYLDVLVVLGCFWLGSRCVFPSQLQSVGEVEDG